MRQRGVWIRAGWTGIVCGVDIAAGLKRIDPTGLDIAVVGQLAARAEDGLLEGIAIARPAGEA